MNKNYQSPEQLLQDLKELHDNVVPRLANNNMFHCQSIQMYDEIAKAKQKFVNMAFDYIINKTGTVDVVVIHSIADNKTTLIDCLWDVFNGSITKTDLRKNTQHSRFWYLNESGILTSNYFISGLDCDTFDEHLSHSELRGIGWNHYFNYERNRILDTEKLKPIDNNHPLKQVLPVFGFGGESLITAVQLVLDTMSNNEMPSFELIDTVVTISKDVQSEINGKQLSISSGVHALYDIQSINKIENEREFYYQFMSMMENL